MEVTALLVFVGGFAVCAAMVLLVSIFGVKEQTFEEALAMQRKNNEKEKSKTKDRKKDGSNKKKNQKWNKRKENDVVVDDPNSDDIAEVDEPVLVEELPISSEDEHTTDTEELAFMEPKSVANTKSKMEIKELNEEILVGEVFNKGLDEKLVTDSVVEVVAVNEPTMPSPVNVEASKPSIKVAKKSGKKQNDSKQGFKELLVIVERSVLNDFEAQQIIDVIVNKHGDSLSLGSGDGWVEKGKLSETAKLQKQLGDAEIAFQEEVMKAQSLKDKMVELRRELNEEKSAKAALSRTVEEMNTSRGQEITNLNAKLNEAQSELTNLQTQLNQQVQHRHQLETSQAHFQDTIDSLNLQLEMSNVAVGTASATAAGEMERVLREEYEAEVSSLREQLLVKTEEAATLGGEAMKLGEVRRELEQVMACKAQLNYEVARLQAENSGLMAANNSAKIVEKELREAQDKLVYKEKETVRLEKKIEEMKLQIVSYPEVDESFKTDLEAMTMKAAALEKENDELKLPRLGDCTLAELDVMTKKAGDLEKDIEFYKSELKEMTKLTVVLEKEKLELKSAKTCDSSVDLLIRLFPNLDTSASSNEIEAAVKQQLATSLEARHNEDTNKLSAQVIHYKKTLDQTESMLTALQASVEDEEVIWKKKLEAVTEELEKQKNLAGNKEQNTNFGIKIEDLGAKCEELEMNLAKEKREKDEALEKLANALLSLEKEIQSVNALMAKSINDAELTQI